MSSRSTSKRKGFTLIELLVVIAVIAILMSLLIPGYARIRNKAMQSACASNIKQLGIAMLSYASDNKGKLPGSDTQEMDAALQNCWVGTEVQLNGFSCPTWSPTEEGALVRYLDMDPVALKKVFRCPSLKPSPIASSEGSNGMFDYAMVRAFAGAPMSMPPTMLIFPDTVDERRLPTPLIVEEDIRYYLNSNPEWVDPGHSNEDRISVVHDGGGHYFALDGSVQFIDAKELPGSGSELVNIECKWWKFDFGDNGYYGIDWYEIDYGDWRNPDPD